MAVEQFGKAQNMPRPLAKTNRSSLWQKSQQWLQSHKRKLAQTQCGQELKY
jgi:hypothetical protein